MKKSLGFLLGLCLLAASCGASQSVVSGNGVEIDRTQLDELIENQFGELEEKPTTAQVAEVLTNEVREQVVPNVAESLGIDTEGKEIQQLAGEIVSLEVQERVPGIVEVAAASQLCARHILVETEDEAQAVLDQLDGGTDFGELAQQVSLDPGSGSAGGDLGCFGSGQLVPEFENAVVSNNPGVIVGPVATDFGFHIIERLEGPPPSDDQIINAGFESAFGSDEEFNEWFGELFAVEVDPRYGEWNAIDVRVVPPSETAELPPG